MTSPMIKAAGISAVAAILLSTTASTARADEYVWRGGAYQSQYDQQRAVIARRGAVYRSRYGDPQADFAYAPAWSGYSGAGDDRCQLSPGSIEYVPCSQF